MKTNLLNKNLNGSEAMAPLVIHNRMQKMSSTTSKGKNSTIKNKLF
jgi:hypothetical protein